MCRASVACAYLVIVGLGDVDSVKGEAEAEYCAVNGQGVAVKCRGKLTIM